MHLPLHISDEYTFYSGDGVSGWPDKSQWVSFVDMLVTASTAEGHLLTSVQVQQLQELHGELLRVE